MFDPLDWLAVAAELGSSRDEARLRISVGRYYYAVFLKSRDSLEAAGLLAPVHSEADHRGVALALRDNKRGVVAGHLDRLRRLRNVSDYDVSASVSSAQVRSARAMAQEVVRLSRSDWVAKS